MTRRRRSPDWPTPADYPKARDRMERLLSRNLTAVDRAGVRFRRALERLLAMSEKDMAEAQEYIDISPLGYRESERDGFEARQCARIVTEVAKPRIAVLRGLLDFKSIQGSFWWFSSDRDQHGGGE